MAIYADLGPIDYFRSATSSWRAVGWLGEGHPFRQGEVSGAFFDRLCTLLLSPWQRFGFLGFHGCDLCPDDLPRGLDGAEIREVLRRRFREQNTMQVGANELLMGCKNLWVPGTGCVYVAPSLIAHYVRAHRYAPPEEFIDAVLRCPDTHSPEYRAALEPVDAALAAAWTATMTR